MTYLLGFLFGVIVASAYSSWAECCSAFNVPFDTQIAISRAELDRDIMAGYRQRSVIPEYRPPCER